MTYKTRPTLRRILCPPSNPGPDSSPSPSPPSPTTACIGTTRPFCDRYQPDLVGFEAEQFQELLVHEFRRQCVGRNLRWPIHSVHTGQVPKRARIRRLSQYVINRELRFRADSPGCRLLVDQLMDFPLAEHDDGPDALEMCMRLPLEAAEPRERVISLARQPW